MFQAWKMLYLVAIALSNSHRPDVIDDILILPVTSEHQTPTSIDYISEETNSNKQWTYQSLDSEIECLAKNIYFEARGEDLKGKLAVALVTVNRVRSEKFPNSICEVVWQRTKRGNKTIAQFSWTLDGKPDTPRNATAWMECYHIAQTVLDQGRLDNVEDFTNGSTFYHAKYVDPKWANLRMVASIGDHVFYIDPQDLTVVKDL